MQKVKGWTAGSKSKELRGLGVKNRTQKQLLLNAQGLRVE